ncbi:MAG: type II secretion system GspH family protein, partial [Armatimonadetes bacterium]|nr:type II secretion system GspH family protein [Armatimonadota bacterium]
RTCAKNRGFTLMELLVVMAISVILMGLVLAPVVQSFSLTRRAQAMVEAQDSARASMEQISRELGEAMDVLDYTADPIDLPVFDPTAMGSSPTYYYLPLPNAKIDFVLPRMIAHCVNPNHPAGEPRDFARGDLASPPCQKCSDAGQDPNQVEIRPRLPLEQDVTVVRYFLGLRYNNPTNDRASGEPPYFGWESPWGKNVAADAGNQVVLYRIEFDPNDTTIFSSNPQQAVQELADVLNDPEFFYAADGTGKVSGSTWSAADNRPLWQHWAEKARIVGMGKYEDLVTGIDTDGDGRFEAIEPSVNFRYAKVDNDTFAGTNSTDKSFEYPDAAPTVFRAKYGYWMPDPFSVSLYRYKDVVNNGASSVEITDYTTGYEGLDLVIRKNGATQVFNISEYMRTRTIPRDCEMAFYFDYAPNGASPVMNMSRGTATFALDPPIIPDNAKSVSDLDPVDINNRFRKAYEANHGEATRWALLSTFDESKPNYLMYAVIVPGSESVIGPNMTPGPGYGMPVRYERLPLALGDPELNQYKINYDTGEIFFSRIYSQDLPETGSNPIRVNYKVQFNRNGDVVRGDYFTKCLVNIHVGIRMFDPDSGKVHTVELNNTVKVRNALR